tara:strand:+ start:516 stop:1211 length:696 start_codon:yes stop_codon:yes gene_type:complete
MGTFRGPNIVTDGLVLALDAGSARSYPGTGTAVTDLAGNFNSVMTNGVAIDSSNGGVFDFDGTDDYIATNNDFLSVTPVSTSTEYTLEAWVYVRTSSGTTTSADCIIGHDSATGFGMQVGVSSSKPRINYGARSTSNFYSSTFEYNEWKHVVLSKRVTDPECFSYLDGVLDVSSGSSLYIKSPSDGDVNIGGGGGRVSGYFDGLMGPVRVYNVALTAAQVLQNYNAQKSRF